MAITIYPTRQTIGDVDALTARCRQRGVRHVCFSVDGLPAVALTTPAGAAALARFNRRLADGGVLAAVLMDSFGHDPAMSRKPAVRQTGLDATRRLLDALHGAGIDVLLKYLHPPMPVDPADDAHYWDGFTTTSRAVKDHASAAGVRVANHAIWHCLPDPLIRGDALDQGVTMSDDTEALVDTFKGTVNVIVPTTTDLSEHTTLLGRFGQPDALHGAALYLASRTAAVATGQMLTVYGGSSL